MSQSKKGAFWRWVPLLSAVAILLLVLFLVMRLPGTPKSAPAPTVAPPATLPATGAIDRNAIRERLYPTDGYKNYAQWSDVPIEDWLLPGEWTASERETIAVAIGMITAILGPEDPVSKQLNGDGAVRGVFPMAFPISVGTGDDIFFADAYWSPVTKVIYVSRRGDAMTLIASNLVQEAVHAIQFPEAVAHDKDTIGRAEIEAHERQLAFNGKFRTFIQQHADSFPAERIARWNAEMDVIDESIREQLEKYRSGHFSADQGRR